MAICMLSQAEVLQESDSSLDLPTDETIALSHVVAPMASDEAMNDDVAIRAASKQPNTHKAQLHLDSEALLQKPVIVEAEAKVHTMPDGTTMLDADMPDWEMKHSPGMHMMQDGSWMKDEEMVHTMPDGTVMRDMDMPAVPGQGLLAVSEDLYGKHKDEFIDSDRVVPDSYVDTIIPDSDFEELPDRNRRTGATPKKASQWPQVVQKKNAFVHKPAATPAAFVMMKKNKGKKTDVKGARYTNGRYGAHGGKKKWLRCIGKCRGHKAYGGYGFCYVHVKSRVPRPAWGGCLPPGSKPGPKRTNSNASAASNSKLTRVAQEAEVFNATATATTMKVFNDAKAYLEGARRKAVKNGNKVIKNVIAPIPKKDSILKTRALRWMNMTGPIDKAFEAAEKRLNSAEVASLRDIGREMGMRDPGYKAYKKHQAAQRELNKRKQHKKKKHHGQYTPIGRHCRHSIQSARLLVSSSKLPSSREKVPTWVRICERMKRRCTQEGPRYEIESSCRKLKRVEEANYFSHRHLHKKHKRRFTRKQL